MMAENMDDRHEDRAPEFEGKPITKFEAILPRITVGAEDHYKSGHVLRVAADLYVSDVHFKNNGDGTLTRQHILTWDSVEAVTSFDPADQVTDGGSSSSTAPQVDEDDDDPLGLNAGRSGDAWPHNVAQMPRREASGE